jgi:hypothetical protein
MFASSGARMSLANRRSLGQRLGKDGVRTRFEVQTRPRQRALDAFGSGRIGARNYAQAPARAARCGNSSRGLVRRREQLIVEVAALLGQELIFNLDRGGPRVLEFAHRAHHIQHPAVSGVRIDDYRQAAGTADAARGRRQFVEGHDAEIG